MKGKTSGVMTVFGMLLVVTLSGILVHIFTGYDYPVSSPATDFELNTLGDIYEVAVLIPLGIMGILAMRIERRWGPLLVTGVTAHFTYNYAMAVTGRQNLWVFVWIAKLALSGIVMCLVWPLLPTGAGLRVGSRKAITVYLALVVLVFSGLMGQRLLASASGRAVDMTMQQSGVVDWGDPVLRDPVVFFSVAAPVMVAGILGLMRGAEWGGKASAASCALVVSIVLFTGPLKELLMTGRIGAPMLAMSGTMLLAAAPAAWSLVRLAEGESRR